MKIAAKEIEETKYWIILCERAVSYPFEESLNQMINELAIAKPDGTIETLFRPVNGINYWKEQIKTYK